MHIKLVSPGLRVRRIHRGGALLNLFKLLIDGEFPLWTHPYITISNLLGLGAKNRPICIMGWLARTAGQIAHTRCTAAEMREEFTQTFADGRIQLLQVVNKIPGEFVRVNLFQNTHQLQSEDKMRTEENQKEYSSLELPSVTRRGVGTRRDKKISTEM